MGVGGKNRQVSENGFVQENFGYFSFWAALYNDKQKLFYIPWKVREFFFLHDRWQQCWIYSQEVKTNPNNYDAWFDYLRLMESEADPDPVREVYERAIANVPPAEEKRLWRRYIYLWVNYALYEELIAKVSFVYQ